MSATAITFADAIDAIDLQLVTDSPEVVLPRDAAVLVACALQDLPDMLAQAWDEGHRASERDWEMVYNLSTPDEDRQPWTNPYRQEG